jgi:hypothetical protein
MTPLHLQIHPHFVQDCFGCKVAGIQFSAGAKTYPKNYYDQAAVDYTFGGQEARDEYMEIVDGMPLKWREEGGRRVAYRKDKVGDYVKADAADLRRVMHGGKKAEKKLESV